MLRTLFLEEHGEPIQSVRPSIEISFQTRDASDWNSASLGERLKKEIYRPFDLEHGPTWRVTVFQNAPVDPEQYKGSDLRDHLVLLTLHHIIGDLWSIAIIMKEIAALYQEEATALPAALKPLRGSYDTYVQAEVERLDGPLAEQAREYWRTILSGELIPLNLPVDHPYPIERSGRGAEQPVRISQKLTAGLRDLAEKQQVKLYTILLAAFQTLLHSFTGQDDILVGFPKSGRSPVTAHVVGYFVNQTVMRSDFTENPRYIDLLCHVQENLDANNPYDWYPFSLLAQRLQPARDPGRSPLIQAVFSWQQAPRLIPREGAAAFVLGRANQTIELDGLQLRSVHLAHRVAPFDLILLATESSEGLEATIEYATDLFDTATIKRMAECYSTLLESIIANPEQGVSDLNLLPETHRNRLVNEWNATAAAYPDQACLHQLFEQQVERTPDLAAVTEGESQLTYRQLNRRANQLAHFLREQGVGPEACVGVYLHPSTQMIVALLGILKAGGVYLPLAPDFPKERLAFMLGDAKPALVITHQAQRLSLPDFAAPVMSLDSDEDQLHAQPGTNLLNRITPDQSAYVMYTSGSTGQPKGALLAHRGVVSLLTDFQNHRAIQSGDACSWWTSPNFDVSIYEIFSPLLAGGNLQVIPTHIRLNPSGLFEWLQTNDIRSAYLPPFFLPDFSEWVKDHPDASSLHRLLVGVEPISNDLLIHLASSNPGLCILNGYGPTEATICSMLYQIDAAQPHPGNAPIGRPVANTQIYLLDSALQPVPVGVLGEVYIGGAGLAYGYLNRPDLTSQKFIPSPFQPDQRLYRTGDLARFLPDGNLMFVGRVDSQVKIHGVRIELGEIEAALSQHPQVRQALVLMDEQPSGNKRLVAYVTSAKIPPLSPADLRKFLSQRLPTAMVPAVFKVLEQFPVSATGKIDRSALRDLSAPQAKEEKTNRAPLTKSENILLNIWQDVLGMEAIGVSDSFFDLGGDSILSLQIAAKAQEAGFHLSPKDIFRAPTIAALAALADAAKPSPKPEFHPKNDSPFPLTPIQHWFFDQKFPKPDHWNQYVTLEPSRPLDPLHLRSAVADLLRHHDSLRLRYTRSTAGWQQTYSQVSDQIPYETIDLSSMVKGQQEKEIARVIAKRERNLDLSTGPLIRVVYFQLGSDDPGRLWIIIHHLAVDGVSWRILIEDLRAAYLQFEQGLPIHLPHTTSGFHEWAWRLADFARSEELMKETNFWSRLARTRASILPVNPSTPDRPIDQLNLESSVRQLSVSLNQAETQALIKQSASFNGSDINTFLLSALARAFRRWTGSSSLWIDLEGHGREQLFENIDLSRTVGWFSTLYPVQIELPADADLSQSIQITHSQLSQIPHHGLGYGIIRYLRQVPESRPAFAPQVSFNYLGQLPQPAEGDLFSALTPASFGFQSDPGAQRTHLIEINAAVFQGELLVDWQYSANIHAKRTIELVANFFIDELKDLISSSQSQGRMRYAPSDFPGVGLSQAELETIRRTATSHSESIPERNLEAVYPLSPMQQGMVFHSLYAPNSGVYFEQTTFTIRKNIDLEAFENAWQRAIARHPVLRTSFVWQGLDRMLQVVQRTVRLPVEILNWRHLNDDQQRAQLDSLLQAERARGFDLTTSPLLRLVLIKEADDRLRVLFNHHHAILDGWSLPLLFREVFDLYTAFIHHEERSFPPVRPYQDYITWLQTRDLGAAKSFWRKELDSFAPALVLPVQASLFTGASQPAEQALGLSSRTTIELQIFARQNHLTLSTLLQGAWALVLSHLSQRDDVAFGVTVAGRSVDFPGAMNMIGLFINSLPLRVHVLSDLPVLNWLRQIQDKDLDLQQYDYTPLAQIQAWCRTSHDTPLFDTLFVFENYPTHAAANKQFDSLQIGNIQTIEQITYPLTIAVLPGEQLTIKVLYSEDHFAPDTIRRLLHQYCQVLESMIMDPDQPLSILMKNGEILEPWKILSGEATSEKHADPSATQRTSGIPKIETSGKYAEVSFPTIRFEEYLKGLWSRLLKVNSVGIHDNFFEMGGDSLNGAICISQIQDALGETIPLSAIFDFPTIFELVRYLEQEYPGGTTHFLGIPVSETLGSQQEVVYPSILVPIQPEGRKTPLFCIHPAGGIVFPYYTLAPYLGKDQPLYGIQDPGLYDPQAAFSNIESLATHYIEVIRKVLPEGPYNLLGWSFGGVVAFEMAQQLTRQGQTVAHLILLDTKAPASHHNPRRSESKNEGWRPVLSWMLALPGQIKAISHAIGPIASYIRSGLFLLSAAAKSRKRPTGKKPAIKEMLDWFKFVAWRNRLLKEAEVAGAISQEASLLLVEMPAVQRILRLVREHIRLGQQYVAQQYPGRITLFYAAKSSHPQTQDPGLGWNSLAKGEVVIHKLQTNHVALLIKPNVEILAKELKVSLMQE